MNTPISVNQRGTAWNRKSLLKNTLTAGGGPQTQDRLESYAEKPCLEQQRTQNINK